MPGPAGDVPARYDEHPWPLGTSRVQLLLGVLPNGEERSKARLGGNFMSPPPAPLRTITVAGEGRVSVTPDVAYVLLGVETADTTLAAAQRENAARMAALRDQLAALEVAEGDTRTAGYSVGQDYGREGPTGRHRVSNVVRATVRDLGRLGEILDAAVAAGANRVHGVSFDLTHRDDALQRAREAAVRDARAKAEQYAALAGVRLGAPVAISESGGAPPLRAEALAMSSKEAARTSIQPGEGAIGLTIQITYEIVPAGADPE